MKIDFKKPRYMLPLIVLPFLCLFFYVYQSGFSAKEVSAPESDSLQEQLADVSEEVKNRALSDKLAVYREQYRRGDGYTAIGQLQEEEAGQYRFDDVYLQQEKNRLDSIERIFQSGTRFSGRAPGEPQAEDQALRAALSQLQHRPEPYATAPAAADPMELFRQQMALADSMARASDPELQAEALQKERMEAARREYENQPRLPVSKYSAGQEHFNTVRPEEEATFIQAVVDETATGFIDSRLRIRLLDDLLVGRHVVRKGTYLYARISGFSGQRIRLSVTSIMQGNTILPVRLEIYDHDGAAGLHVPASAFREFSRELGGNTAQSIMLTQQAESQNQLLMSTLQRMFQSASTAVSRHIRKNKAKLKYNTLVYLVDPAALRGAQQNY